MNKSEYLHIRIDSELKEKLKQLAEAEHRTVSNYIEAIIKRELEKQGK